MQCIAIRLTRYFYSYGRSAQYVISTAILVEGAWLAGLSWVHRNTLILMFLKMC